MYSFVTDWHVIHLPNLVVSSHAYVMLL